MDAPPWNWLLIELQPDQCGRCRLLPSGGVLRKQELARCGLLMKKGTKKEPDLNVKTLLPNSYTYSILVLPQLKAGGSFLSVDVSVMHGEDVGHVVCRVLILGSVGVCGDEFVFPGPVANVGWLDA